MDGRQVLRIHRGKPRILFVEDEATVREHLARALSDEYEVDTAGDGEQALRAVLKKRPDLVIADVVMPGLDGVELLRTLRGTPSTQGIPVLLTSGQAPEELRLEGFEQGADGYLPKPYTERELRVRIRSMLQGAQRRREAAHREAREQAEKDAMVERGALLESITDAFYALDRHWRFIYVNQRALDFYDARREALLGRRIWEVFPVLKESVFQEQYERALREQRSVAFEAISPILNRWLDVHAYPTPHGLAVNFTDITTRKDAEKELHAALVQLQTSEERFRTLAQAVPAMVFVSDPAGLNVYTNTQYQAFVGVPPEALLGAGWLDALHPDDRGRAAETWRQAVAGGGPYAAEYRFRRHDGAYRWFLVRGLPARDADGQVATWYGTCTDVDESKRIAEALDEEKRTLETLNRLGQSIAAELDLKSAVQAVTDAATGLTGAGFGAFFYNEYNPQGEAYTLYALSGAPREAFANFPMPRNTAVFGPTFRGEAVVRSDDITKDPRYGRNAPRRGMPPGHLPVRSYLAAPVVSRSGEVLGGLFFGHAQVGVFTDRAERLIVGIAAQAAIAIDNARLYQAARDADRRKDEFLAVLAHELRNPLAPIRNGLQIIRLRASADPTLQGVVNMMDRQMTHVVRLVDDLLDVSRINSGKLELRREKLRLTDVLASAVDASRVFIEAHGHELSIDVRTEGLTVDGDPERLAQVVSNLLSNSAKYTERGGRIILTLMREQDDAVLRVQDTGVGIPSKELDRVFEMFSQIVPQHGRTHGGGLGIGLSLVKTLVHMHDGSVSASSDGVGAGSTFTVRLPLIEPLDSPSPAGGPDTSVAPKPASTRARRILVADDNRDAAASLSMLLELEGHEVRTAADGHEAVEQAEKFRPHVIFMDVGMPRMDGLEATRRIRALPSGRTAFIVAVTGWGQAPDRQRTSEAGMDQHLVKPVSAEALYSVLADLAETTGQR